MTQFGKLDEMQTELLTANPATRIRILGVNAAGFTPISTTATIPWLQDTAAAGVWGSWGGFQRALFVLDPQNVRVRTYNLNPTFDDLTVQANYDAVKAYLKSVAGE